MFLSLGAVALAVASLVGCSRSLPATGDAYFQKQPIVAHDKPESMPDDGEWWDMVLHSTVRPLSRVFSPAHYAKAIAGKPGSLDVNDFGQVPDSGWFENRINRGTVDTADIARGPAPERAPAAGPLVIISGKLAGVSPGFVVRDAAGVVWFVKFDEPAFPRLSTSAEIIASRLLHAAGYHVPEMFLLDLDLGRLELAADARTRDHYNRLVKLTGDGLAKLLKQLNPDADNRLRALFSRAVPGEPVGPFHYRGIRGDDPNDTVPHHRRRSLRGLRVFYAWLNNTDARYQNTLDTFVSAGGDRGHIVHYLIDFGDSLGAASASEKSSAKGYERLLDWHEIGLRWVTLGFRDPEWFAVKRSPLREVGVFESKVFKLDTWNPVYNNPAFEASDRDDERWAAGILAHISEADVRAAVAAGRYKERAAGEWITRVLMRRRAKILRSVFADKAPIDLPRVLGSRLHVTDLVELSGIAERPARYRWSARWNRPGERDRHLGSAVTDGPSLDLAPVVAGAKKRWSDFGEAPRLTFRIRREAAGIEGGPWAEIDVVIRDGRAFPTAMRWD